MFCLLNNSVSKVFSRYTIYLADITEFLEAVRCCQKKFGCRMQKLYHSDEVPHYCDNISSKSCSFACLAANKHMRSCITRENLVYRRINLYNQSLGLVSIWYYFLSSRTFARDYFIMLDVGDITISFNFHCFSVMFLSSCSSSAHFFITQMSLLTVSVFKVCLSLGIL